MRARAAIPSYPIQGGKRKRDLPLRGCNPGQNPIAGAVQTVMRVRQQVERSQKKWREYP